MGKEMEVFTLFKKLKDFSASDAYVHTHEPRTQIPPHPPRRPHPQASLSSLSLLPSVRILLRFFAQRSRRRVGPRVGRGVHGGRVGGGGGAAHSPRGGQLRFFGFLNSHVYANV